MLEAFNRYQARLLPGTPDARRNYCTCPAPADGKPAGPHRIMIHGEDAYLILDSCPLHGRDPVHELPKGL